ncbi:helix-turn-helix domain-containing protein [Dyadobacter arcticus]|nr:helix-turn-helix transcriptional regulator [Dyadobacter arcticus]
MELNKKNKIARRVRESRAAKGLTQLELSDMNGISLRSIQRIENGEVQPRLYTVKVLAEHLDFVTEPFELEDAIVPLVKTIDKPEVVRRTNKTQKIILTIGVASVIVLLVSAYIFQSPTFPETAFEAALLWAAVAIFYTMIVFLIWR